MNQIPIGSADWVWALWGVAPVLVAVVTTWGQRQIKARQDRHDEKLSEVKEQVSNSHKSNLRDDVDKVLDGNQRVIDSNNELKAFLFDMDRKMDGLTSRIDGVDRKVEVYRAVTERVLEQNAKHNPEG